MKLTIGRKILSGFLIIIVLLVVLSTISMVNMRTMGNYAKEIESNWMPTMQKVTEVRKELLELDRLTLRVVLENDSKEMERLASEATAASEKLEATKQAYSSLLVDKAEQAIYSDFLKNEAPYRELLKAIWEAGLASELTRAVELIDDSREFFIPASSALTKAIEWSVEGANQATKRSVESYQSGQLIVIIVSIVAIILGLIIAIFFGRMISRPIITLSHAAEKLAQGDLDITIAIKSKDEIGDLSHSFQTMVANLNEVLGNISVSSEQVASGSRQVSDSSLALSQGSTEQASSIEQLTASMEEISAQTKQNAMNANQANELSIHAADHASQGNNQMKEMLRAMEEINESSANISKIIKVIDEIAFQTNILALNAAVEAARAGQHGKGFAVVAEEVRNLAARSANAAKETTVMIEGSIKKVEAGTKIANITAEALNKIVDGVAKSATLVASIANASNEQATGITQVNLGISQVSEVTQTNSATSEECAAASEELSGQADLLREMVSKFKLKMPSMAESNTSLSPDIIKMLENLSNSRSSAGTASIYNGYEQAAATKSKVKISLDDGNFGKY